MRFRSPTRPALENLPNVSSKFLAELGLFRTELVKPVGLYSYGLHFVAINIRSGCIAFIQQANEGTSHFYEIDSDYFRTGKFYKPYFICPVTGLLTSRLLFAEGLWASRRGLGLRVKNGTPVQRKRLAEARLVAAIERAFVGSRVQRRTKQRVIRELEDHLTREGYVSRPVMPLADYVDQQVAAEEAAKRQEMRHHRQEGLTLAKALREGRPIEGDELRALARYAGSHSAPVGERARSPGQRRRAAQHNHLCLDLKSLRSAGMLQPSCTVGRLIDLPGSSGPSVKAAVVVDLGRERSHISVVFFGQRGSSARTQLISLQIEENLTRRFRLICPIAGTRHDQLFLRDGYFASAAVQRVMPTSQL